MQAEYKPDDTKPWIAFYCVYFAFLLLPLITLVLLQTTVWHQNNSECDPFTPTYVFVPPMTADIEGVVKSFERYEYRKGKCTCLVEYPRYMYILAGFEILVFVYLCVSDPFTNTPYSTILAACKSPLSLRLMFILIFEISYLTLNGLAFSALIQSNASCGTALVGWSSMSFAFRIVLVIVFILPPRLPLPQRERVLSIQFSNLYTAVHTQQVIAL